MDDLSHIKVGQRSWLRLLFDDDAAATAVMLCWVSDVCFSRVGWSSGLIAWLALQLPQLSFFPTPHKNDKNNKKVRKGYVSGPLVSVENVLVAPFPMPKMLFNAHSLDLLLMTTPTLAGFCTPLPHMHAYGSQPIVCELFLLVWRWGLISTKKIPFPFIKNRL